MLSDVYVQSSVGCCNCEFEKKRHGRRYVHMRRILRELLTGSHMCDLRHKDDDDDDDDDAVTTMLASLQRHMWASAEDIIRAARYLIIAVLCETCFPTGVCPLSSQ